MPWTVSRWRPPSARDLADRSGLDSRLGTEVTGPAEAVLMAIAGRRIAFGELAGPG